MCDAPGLALHPSQQTWYNTHTVVLTASDARDV
jgi:hypothetical protein